MARARGPLAAAAAAALALAPAARSADVPRGKEVIEIDLIPGKMGVVRFGHAEHVRKFKRPDGTPIRCRDCHHTLQADEPSRTDEVMRCSACHARIGEPEKAFDGKRARALAALKPDGAIDHNSVLFHDYCRNCHRKSTGSGRMLGGCKVCHERGVGTDVLHGPATPPAPR